MTIPASEQALAGYEGHLNKNQQAAFDEFKQEVAKELEAGTISKWYDDTTILRFLRARSWNVAKAKKQFMTTDQWRKQTHPDDVYRSIPVEELHASQRYYPRWTGRRDRMGRPIYVYRIGSITKEHQDSIFSKSEEDRYKAIIALTEMLSQFVFGMCSRLPHESQETPISCVTSIIDLSGISLGLIWTLRSHLQQSMALSSAHYPETLNTIAVVNAPSFFPIIWNRIKYAFDEGTRNKIHILGADPGPVLEEIIKPEDLPKIYGGELEWKYEDEPVLDSETRNLIGADSLPLGPLVWKGGKIVPVGEQDQPAGDA